MCDQREHDSYVVCVLCAGCGTSPRPMKKSSLKAHLKAMHQYTVDVFGAPLIPGPNRIFPNFSHTYCPFCNFLLDQIWELHRHCREYHPLVNLYPVSGHHFVLPQHPVYPYYPLAPPYLPSTQNLGKWIPNPPPPTEWPNTSTYPLPGTSGTVANPSLGWERPDLQTDSTFQENPFSSPDNIPTPDDNIELLIARALPCGLSPSSQMKPGEIIPLNALENENSISGGPTKRKAGKTSLPSAFLVQKHPKAPSQHPLLAARRPYGKTRKRVERQLRLRITFPKQMSKFSSGRNHNPF